MRDDASVLCDLLPAPALLDSISAASHPLGVPVLPPYPRSTAATSLRAVRAGARRRRRRRRQRRVGLAGALALVPGTVFGEPLAPTPVRPSMVPGSRFPAYICKMAGGY